jgi:hypothetical protein
VEPRRRRHLVGTAFNDFIPIGLGENPPAWQKHTDARARHLLCASKINPTIISDIILNYKISQPRRKMETGCTLLLVMY